MNTRKIAYKYAPLRKEGFLGEGHQAAMVFERLDFSRTDPFIMLADDRLDLSGAIPTGGPHPHAGLEIAMFIVDGKLPENEKVLHSGDLEFLTTGSGIVHSEAFDQKIDARILQLWLTLPKKDRWTKPREQQLHLGNIPIKKDGDNEIRVYSGSSQGLTAPTQNYVPVTIVDFHLNKDYTAVQVLPSSYNAFIYLLSGSVSIGEEKEVASSGDVVWFDIPQGEQASQISFISLSDSTRFVLYAGEPQHAPIIQAGPFIADSKEDIPPLYNNFRKGAMTHVKDFTELQVIRYQPA